MHRQSDALCDEALVCKCVGVFGTEYDFDKACAMVLQEHHKHPPEPSRPAQRQRWKWAR